ncbi:MAG: hypothetical protein HY420_01945 [Candidatus Kerfeldbacteria bacterium]|nr:hypothetical protein [Candidatus Kerfeldbacteria bacterium]
MKTLKSILFPACYALWPVFLLWLNNIDVVRSASVVRSLVVVGAAALVVSLVLIPIIRQPARRTLALCLFWLFFFSYGLFLWDHRDVNTTLPSQFFFFDYYFLFVYVFTLCCLLVATLGTRRVDLVTHASNIVGSTGVFLLVLTLGQIGFHQVRSAGDDGYAPAQTVVAAKPREAVARLPDIYYIVLDGHGRADVLQEFYGYDSSQFIRELEALGFYVARESTSNYPYTYLSIPSALNLGYVNEAAPDLRSYIRDRRPLMNMMGYSQAYQFLKQYEYTFVTFGSGWSADSNLPTADLHYESPTLLNEFENMLLGNSLMIPFGYRRIQYYLHREGVRYFFDHLADVASIPQPTLTYAHIMVPHPPFVFGSDGEPILPNLPFVFDDVTWRAMLGKTSEAYVNGYRGQVTYVDQVLIQVLRQILASSPQPPVIIIQGDHGPASVFANDHLTVDGVRERFSILNAYYLPNGTTTLELYPTITPVNSFRAIFNTYFGTQLDFLEDKSYIPVTVDSEIGYEMLDVTPYLTPGKEASGTLPIMPSSRR